MTEDQYERTIHGTEQVDKLKNSLKKKVRTWWKRKYNGAVAGIFCTR